MRLATWNVNSIRSRVDRVVEWLSRAGVDVLAVQETKCRDGQFPMLPFTAAGYEVVHHGHNQWNGVAIISRVGIEDVEVGFPGMPTWGEPAAAEARAMAATCAGVRVWSLYVPNGRTLTDPHLAYKLDWLQRLREAGREWLEQDPAAQVALVGDWNVAPLDEDVWNMAKFAGSTHVSPAERAAPPAFGPASPSRARQATPRDRPNSGRIAPHDHPASNRPRFAAAKGAPIQPQILASKQHKQKPRATRPGRDVHSTQRSSTLQ